MNEDDDLAALMTADVPTAAPEAPKIVPQSILPGEIEGLVAEYRELRDELSDRRKDYQEYEARVKGRQDEISMRLREISDVLGLETLVTRAGTAYKTKVEHFRVGNWDSIVKYIDETKNFHILEKRVAKLNVKEIYEDTGQLPPGIEYSSEVEFRVMKNSKSK